MQMINMIQLLQLTSEHLCLAQYSEGCLTIVSSMDNMQTNHMTSRVFIQKEIPFLQLVFAEVFKFRVERYFQR